MLRRVIYRKRLPRRRNYCNWQPDQSRFETGLKANGRTKISRQTTFPWKDVEVCAMQSCHLRCEGTDFQIFQQFFGHSGTDSRHRQTAAVKKLELHLAIAMIVVMRIDEKCPRILLQLRVTYGIVFGPMAWKVWRNSSTCSAPRNSKNYFESKIFSTVPPLNQYSKKMQQRRYWMHYQGMVNVLGPFRISWQSTYNSEVGCTGERKESWSQGPVGGTFQSDELPLPFRPGGSERERCLQKLEQVRLTLYSLNSTVMVHIIWARCC